MKRALLEVREALERGQALPFALLRCWSSAYLGKTPELPEEEELTEARFFSDRGEIRLWREDGVLRASLLEDEEGDHTMDETYRLENPAFGSLVTVRRYIGFDGDGQACVTAWRLCDWKGGEEHG